MLRNALNPRTFGRYEKFKGWGSTCSETVFPPPLTFLFCSKRLFLLNLRGLMGSEEIRPVPYKEEIEGGQHAPKQNAAAARFPILKKKNISFI
jgi:hypothetical protein